MSKKNKQKSCTCNWEIPNIDDPCIEGYNTFRAKLTSESTITQKEFEKAIRSLPLPSEFVDNEYQVVSYNSKCIYVFKKNKVYVYPHRVALIFWKLSHVETIL